MKYTFGTTEEYIKAMYLSIGIYSPHQLDMETISSRLGTSLVFLPYKSMTIHDAILIDSRLSKEQQWQDFGHELCHVRWHDGNQRVMTSSYLDYQEEKATNFAYHACIPSFMVERIVLPRHEKKAIWALQETFKVEHDFAKERLEQYKRNRQLLEVWK